MMGPHITLTHHISHITHHTHTGLVGDAALLVVAGVTLPLLSGDVVSEEGGVTLLSQFVFANNLVLPDSLWNLNRTENAISNRCNNDMKARVEGLGGKTDLHNFFYTNRFLLIRWRINIFVIISVII